MTNYAESLVECGPEYDLGTSELLTRVIEDLRDADPDLRHLVVLHQRPTRAVLNGALELTRSAQPHVRVVGLRILRELGPAPRPSSGERTFVKETVWRVAQLLVDTNEDAEVIGWAISVAGYMGEQDLLPEVLRHIDSEDRTVRFHIAAALPSLVSKGDSSKSLRRALDSLCRDPDADTRYYALHAIIEEIGIAASISADVVSRLLSDPDEQVRRLAMKAWAPGAA